MNQDPPTRQESGDDLTPLLLAQLRDRHPEGKTLLKKLYGDALLSFCVGYLGRVDEAEDAVQEVFCKVLEADDVPEGFRPWLFKVARNHCLNALRDRPPRREEESGQPGLSQVVDTLTGHLTRLVRDEQRAHLAALLAKLSDAQREVLRLRYVEELSRSEIAEILDLPESVVKSRLFEGVQRLREYASSLGES